MAYLSRRPRTEIRGPHGTRSVPARSEPPVAAAPPPRYAEADEEPTLAAPPEPEPRPRRERPDEVRRWRNHTRAEALLALVLGVVALLTPMWGGAQPSAELSAQVTGIVIIVVAIVAFVAAWAEWALVVRVGGWLSGLAALWLIVAPVFVRQDIIYFITHVVVGLLLLVVAGEMIMGTGRIREYREERSAERRAAKEARAA